MRVDDVVHQAQTKLGLAPELLPIRLQSRHQPLCYIDDQRTGRRSGDRLLTRYHERGYHEQTRRASPQDTIHVPSTLPNSNHRHKTIAEDHLPVKDIDQCNELLKNRPFRGWHACCAPSGRLSRGPYRRLSSPYCQP